jgi:plasmid stabilization system protein ParE
MPARCSLHPEALFEFSEATRYYLRRASPEVADAYVSCIEMAIAEIAATPQRWGVVEAPEVRRFVCKRFPFVLYYRWDAASNQVTVFAIMHCSREPGYWHNRRPE